MALVLVGGLSVKAQHEHHHIHEAPQTYDDMGLGFDIYTDPELDLTTLPREGVFQGAEIFNALANNDNFDFRYCPEFQTENNSYNPDAQFVVFCIPLGTKLSQWNLSERQKIERDGTLEPALDKMPRFGPVQLRAGQTLRLINLDSGGDDAVHRLHVFDKPCYHQPRLMTPALYNDRGELLAATYYDCPTKPGIEWNSEKEDGTSELYNHQTKAPFYLRIRTEDAP